MSKNPNISPLEEQIKSLLSQHESAAPASSWEAIENQIPQVDPSLLVKTIEAIKSLTVLKASIGIAVLGGLIYGAVTLSQEETLPPETTQITLIEETPENERVNTNLKSVIKEKERNNVASKKDRQSTNDALTSSNNNSNSSSNSIVDSVDESESQQDDRKNNQSASSTDQLEQKSSISPDDTSVCEGQKVPFSLVANSETQITSWYVNGSRISKRSNAIWVSATQAEQQVEVEYIYKGEIFRAKASLKALALPTSLNKEMLKDGLVLLSPKWNGPTKVAWKTADQTKIGSNNSIQIPVNQMVYAEVTIGNCNTTLQYVPELQTDLKTAEIFFIPNAFSPNDDGKNDRYLVSTKNVESFFIEIRNGNGQKVYQSTNPKEGWNGLEMNGGSACRAGLYIGKIVAIGSDGKKVQKTIQINLIRNN